MKNSLKNLFLIVISLALGFSFPTIAANRTTIDRNIKAVDRTVGDEAKMYTLSLSGATVSNIDLGADVKSTTVKCIGEDVLLNASYYDGVAESHNIGDLITAGTDPRILRTFNNESFLLIQEYEYTHIFAGIADGDGTAECYFYPGGGISQ